MAKVNDPVITRSMLDKTLKKNNELLSKTIIDEIGGILDVFAAQIDERFNKVEKRLDRIEKSIDRLTKTIDGFVKRLDEVETEQVARDAEVQRLKLWVEQIAKETGVKLKGFTN